MGTNEVTRIVTDEEKREAKNFNIFDLPDVPTGLPPHLELQRTRVVCKKDSNIHPTAITFSGAYSSMGVDNSVRLENFSEDFKVDVISLTETDMVFDMIGVHAGIANAFRRILLAELPSMAIEKVYVANNTSVIQDEVLAHRLGLIPIAADPRLFEYLSENDQPNEKNTIVFKLHVKCLKGDPRRKVLTSELKWLPNGSELIKESGGSTTTPKTYTSFNHSQDSFPEFAENPIRPTLKDILIAKLGPGQEIELEAHAVKGIGKTHAKWSPVATAWYRMLPEVVLLKEFEGKHAEELVKVCPKKVFDIEDMGQGRKRATVARPRDCSLCRECIRDGVEWEDQVDLRRVKNHFIFTIESTGSQPPEVLFNEAVKILEDKCERVISELS
ncbi:RNA polymerase subunit (isoform B) [Arabidopsis thaliana]|jgi:DNA-directed RNA polymerase I and III subunit RPAC1|uniref:DNA-directed RNA polymerases I and III subunit RPAC1 n=4 Tax=Arabidopsis TaxID=3701 RepID=Q39216_ARATH|nr:RNA polymerase I subunit 43 [Arabidopsis thaliana]KAG7650091.1 DNA-directed RNA polymerase RpoA/D/Rpb3-type [Arabidopsis thaliana x Arabidopsis arenosa]AAB00529.1 RNA polymerase subunit [Arabidopsis thaliana]AAB71974.1 RNA polymerase subunit (isoform B) [Arabidopsis thaliana]AAK62414.1 RNA polymerase subunit (isoform B) [Arabidopsis thaliana]AAN65048.1 RNA polymerase subunit (isoform B) [Arabidopsis thaliana]|eukprot:NP_176261.1 RNA polymerase I subunit 43 [Arabidopsis thaliana]